MALTIEELLGIQREREERVREAAKKIAPVGTSGNAGARSYAERYIESEMAPYKLVSNNVNSGFAPIITVKPTVTSDQNNRTWFKPSSYFDDGWDRWDVTKTILGTVADVSEDIISGIADMPEKVTDALTMFGTALSKANINQANFNMMSSPLALSKKGNELASGLVAQSNAIQKESEKAVSQFVAKDLYDANKVAKSIVSAPIKSLTGMDVESASVLGEKSDSLVQSGGQLLATAGLNAIGVPWFLTTGATSFGGQAETALNEGADYNQAFMSATISAGAEILSEKLSGGIKFKLPGQEAAKTLDDVLLKPLTEKISNKVVKSLANFGVDALGEGGEEFFSSVVTNLGTALYKEDGLSEILLSEEALDEYLESFIGGLALGGFVSGARSYVNRNAIELDEIDQKVYDKVVEDKISEAKANGENITKAKEKEIRKTVLRELLRGGIDTDIIESVHGEDMYTSYKDILDKFDNYESKLNDGVQKYKDEYSELQKEYDKLNELNLNKAKLGDYNRQTEIKTRQKEITDQISQWNAELKKLNGSKTDKTMTDLKNKLSKTVYEKVKNSRVAESYREIERQNEAFKPDFEKYKGTKNEDAVKKTLENAVKGGVNNTNRMRDLVEMNAKLSADTGIVFDYKDGEQIKNDFIERQTNEIAKLENIPEAKRTDEQIQNLAEMKDTLEKVQSGKLIVDGDITSGGITINLDSPKALNRLTGHEITHSFENAEAYEKLKDTLFEYAKSKGVDIDGELLKLTAKYQGVKDANPEAELVADLVGDYLFTDYDFIKHLSVENPNIFKKFWNEIKYLCKIATADSKEARQLEKVKHQFEKAYKESAVSGAKVEGVKNSITEAFVDESGKTNYSLSSEQEAYFKDSKVRDENGNLKVMYHGTSKGGFTSFDTYGSNYGLMGTGSYFTDNKSVAESYTKKGRGNNPQVYETYLNITNPLDMDAEADVGAWAKALPDADFTNCTTNEDCYRAMEEYFEDEQYSKWEASEIAIDAIRSMGYDGITHIGGGRVNADGVKHQVYIAFEPEQIKNIDNTAPTSDPDIRYSLSDIEDSAELPWENNAKDSEGNKLTQKQVDYFEGSQAVDRNGNLLKVYHTTKNDFTVFDKSKKGEATEDANTYLGFFFTDDAEHMQNFPEFENGKTESYYLDMKNPIDMTDISEEAFLDIVEVMGGDVDEAADVYAQELADEERRAKLRGDNNVSLTLGNLLNELAGEFYYDDFIRELQPNYDTLMAKGYDGVINYMDELLGVKEYIVLDSNQAKLTSNKNPTADADVRYSLSENIDNVGKILYDKNNPLSIVNRAKTNNNSSLNWVYNAEIFSTKENKLFHDKISEINQGSEAFSKNSAGEYMLPIENKIVFTDGNYDSPYVREIVEVLTEYQTEFEDIKRCIYNVEKGESSKQDEARFVYLTYGKGRIITYKSGISGVYGWENGQRKGKTRRTVVGNYLKKQYRGRNGRTSQETPINEIAPVKEASSTDGVFFDAEKTKFSLSEDSNGRKLTNEQQDFFKRVSPLLKDENGNIKRYYHGTARGDRVGTLFDPERATSGPMAFFTDNPEIAEGYSKSKADTSMSYDPDYDSYETQFRVNINGNDMSLINAWRYLPMSAKARIKDRAEHTHYDWEDYETLVYDEETTEANGGFSWQLREARGNVFQALNEQWLNSGTLFREENKYLDVLKFIGVYDEFKKLGYGDPYYKDPYYREEKVFEVYLNVTNPFHTADVDEEFLNDARDWVDNTDLSIYESETADSDLWDKRSLDPYEWLDRLESDIENGTTHAWTSIPDVITDFLKEYGGYDGIVDAGGKHTGYGHQVVIPFYSEQIKNIDNETPTTDAHIDLSLSEEGEQSYVAPMNHEALSKYPRTVQQPTDIAPVQQTVSKTEKVAPTQTVQQDIAPTRDVKAKATPRQSEELIGMSQIGSKTPDKQKNKTWSDFVRNFVSKGAVFETTALKSGNRALEDKYKMWKDRSEAKAQYFMENGNGDVKSLKSIVDKAKKSGLYKEFDLYLAHVHNMSRMLYDKPVFGSDVTGDMSLRVASKLQKQHPEFKEWSKDLYKYNDYLLQKTVDGGLISQEFADELSKKYPNYVPIERIVDGSDGLNADGVFVGNPIKTAIGGSQAFESPLKAMAHRTTQVFKAVDKNAFGVELKNTLGGNVEATGTNTEDILDGLALMDDSLLQPGKDGKNPTFTVFENGNRVTFDISEEMYKALQPTTEALSREHKIVSVPSKLHKKVLTEYNLFFTARNFPKDAQEVIINSKHPAKTYANMPVAVAELIKGGKYATEYWENGGKSNTYFDSRENDFSQDDGFVKKAIGLVPNGISKINDFVEAIPRLSEYIASRKNGATIEASMLDAARVTTDFADGGDVTKFFNRNGVTFLNASVQGVSQQVRNIRQAKAEGFKGVMKLVGKYALSGLPTILFNHLMWDDDEEYEELSEYVKDSYYVVAKYGDGQFVRIPKGRTAAVIQEAVEQVCNLITNEEVNWDDVIGSGKSVYESFMSNIAPNNPIDNNVLSPIKQAISGTAWYGDDIVPARLQDLPAKEQFDESTDSISKWLGEKTGISPYKINYLLNQYSGFIGDIVLPPLTAEAERGDGSALGNLLAPLKDQFVVDAVIKNRNPSDFYTLSDELEVKANSKDATDEDRVKQAYITNISYEMGDLYKQKREIQNSNLSDDLKFKQVREIQSQINEMAKNALETYENVKVDGKYATVNDIPYKYLDDKGKWYELYDYEVEKMNDATKILGITPGEYWGNKDEYDMKAFYPEKYAVLQEEGISVKDYKEKYEEKYTYYADDYSWAGNNPEKYTFSKAITDSVVDYRKITSELYDIRADKDENGNSISGTAKAKKQAYIWSLDIEEPQKYLLFKSEYNSYDDHNQEIVDYIIGRDDLTYEEKKTILTNIGFTVDDNGNISG